MSFNLKAKIVLRPPTNAAKIAATIRSQLQNINASVAIQVSRQGTNNLKKANIGLKNVSKNAKSASKSINNFGEQMGLAAKRFFAFSIATAGIMKFVGSIREGTKEAISFQREMVKISQVTGNTIVNLRGISKEIGRLSTLFGVNSGELLKASRMLAQTGMSADNVKISLEALAKSDLAPTFDNINNTTEASIAIFRQFGKEAKDLEGVLGSINAVSGKFAVESGDIAAAVRRTGGAFAAAGGDLNDLIALFTSVRSTTRESAESIATGFRTIFTRLQRVSTQNFLKTLGIDLRNLDGQFVGPYEATRRLSVALTDLRGTDPRFSQIIEELGGFRQVSKVIPLIQQFSVAEKARGVAIAGSSSLSQDATIAQQSLGVQIQKTREQFALMIRGFAESTSFKTMLKLALGLANAFITMANALKPLVPLIATLGAIGIGKVAPTLLSGVRNVLGLKFAAGGIVPGVGSGDTVPARLTPGEFVIKKSSVNSIGAQNLRAMGNGGSVNAMLTPGEFVFNKNTASRIGMSGLTHINEQGSIPEFAAEGGYGSLFKPRLTVRSGGRSGMSTGDVGRKKQWLQQRITYLREGLKENLLDAKDKQELKRLEDKLKGIAKSRGPRLAANKGIISRSDVAKYRGYNKGGVVGRIKKMASGGSFRGTSVQSFAGGGIMGGSVAGAGLMLAGVSSLLSGFEGTIKTIMNYLLQFGSQMGILVISLRATGNSFGKFDQKIDLYGKSIERARGIKSKIKEDVGIGAPTQRQSARIALADRTINDRKKSIASQNKLAKVTQATAIGIGSLGAVATFAGGLLEKAGRENIKSGGSGSSLVVGSALSTGGMGIGFGGAIGMAIAGPVGAAVGAGIGGLGGALMGWMNGKSEALGLIQMREFNKSLVIATAGLESLSDGTSTFEQQKPRIKDFVRSTRSTLALKSTSGQNRQDILAGAKQQLGGFNIYLSEAAKTVAKMNTEGDVFQAFLNEAGKDIFYFTAKLSDLPYSMLEKQMRDQIDGIKKGIEFQNDLNTLNDTYADRIRNIINLSSAFNSVSMSMKQFNSEIDSLLNMASGGIGSRKMLDESARLGIPDKFFDPEQLAKILNRDITNNKLLDTTFPNQTQSAGSILGDEVAQAAHAIRKLPDILLKLKNSLGGFESEDVIGKLMIEFEKMPKFVKDSIKKSAMDFMGNSGGEQKFIEALNNDLPGMAKKLGAAFKPTLEVAALISTKMTEEVNRRSEFIAKLTELTSKEIELKNKVADVGASAEKIRATADRKPNNLPLLQKLDDQKLKNIGAGSNPIAIGNRLQTAQNKLTELRLKRDKEGLDVGGKLTAQIEAQTNIVTRSNAALDFLQDVAGRTSTNMEKLSKIQLGTKFKEDLVDRYLSIGTQEEAMQMDRTLQGARYAQQFGLQNIPRSSRGEVVSLFKSLGSGSLGVFNNESGDDVIKRFRQEVGFNIPTAKEDKVKSDIDLQIKAAETAANVRAEIFKKGVQASVDTFSTSIGTFVQKLERILNQQSIQRLDTERFGKHGEKIKLENTRDALISFNSRFGGDEDRVGQIGNNLSQLQQLTDMQDKKIKYKDFVAGASGTIDASKLTSFGGASAGMTYARQRSFKKDDIKSMISEQYKDIKENASEQSANVFLKYVHDNDNIYTDNIASGDDVYKMLTRGTKVAVADAESQYENLDTLQAQMNAVFGDGQILADNEKALMRNTETYKEMQKEWSIFKDSDTLPKLNTQIETLTGTINSLTRDIIKIKAPIISGVIDSATTGILGMSKGGVVPGHGNRDTVPAMLTPGEIVIPKMANGGFVAVKKFIEDMKKGAAKQHIKNNIKKIPYDPFNTTKEDYEKSLLPTQSKKLTLEELKKSNPYTYMDKQAQIDKQSAIMSKYNRKRDDKRSQAKNIASNYRTQEDQRVADRIFSDAKLAKDQRSVLALPPKEVKQKEGFKFRQPNLPSAVTYSSPQTDEYLKSLQQKKDSPAKDSDNNNESKKRGKLNPYEQILSSTNILSSSENTKLQDRLRAARVEADRQKRKDGELPRVSTPRKTRDDIKKQTEEKKENLLEKYRNFSIEDLKKRRSKLYNVMDSSEPIAKRVEEVGRERWMTLVNELNDVKSVLTHKERQTERRGEITLIAKRGKAELYKARPTSEKIYDTLATPFQYAGDVASKYIGEPLQEKAKQKGFVGGSARIVNKGFENISHMVGTVVGGVKTAGFGVSAGYYSAKGQITKDETDLDYAKRRWELTSATASDTRGHMSGVLRGGYRLVSKPISFLAKPFVDLSESNEGVDKLLTFGSSGAEQEQLTGGVGFSEGMGRGEKRWLGKKSGLLDFAIEAGLNPIKSKKTAGKKPGHTTAGTMFDPRLKQRLKPTFEPKEPPKISDTVRMPEVTGFADNIPKPVSARARAMAKSRKRFEESQRGIEDLKIIAPYENAGIDKINTIAYIKSQNIRTSGKYKPPRRKMNEHYAYDIDRKYKDPGRVSFGYTDDVGKRIHGGSLGVDSPFATIPRMKELASNPKMALKKPLPKGKTDSAWGYDRYPNAVGDPAWGVNSNPAFYEGLFDHNSVYHTRIQNKSLPSVKPHTPPVLTRTKPSRSIRERRAYQEKKFAQRRRRQKDFDVDYFSGTLSNNLLKRPLESVSDVREEMYRFTDSLGISRAKAKRLGIEDIEVRIEALQGNDVGSWHNPTSTRPGRIRLDKFKHNKVTVHHEMTHWLDWILGKKQNIKSGKIISPGKSEDISFADHMSNARLLAGNDAYLSTQLIDNPRFAKVYKAYKANITEYAKEVNFSDRHVNYRLQPLEALASMMSDLPKGSILLDELIDIMRPFGLQQGGSVTRFNTGSLVPGSGSGDKVRALLEPGEFVMNRNAVSAAGVGNLDRFNKKHSRFQTGGPVGAQASAGISPDFSDFTNGIIQFVGIVPQFVDATARLVEGLQNIPTEISMMGTHNVNVTISGANALSTMMEPIRNLVTTEINKAMRTLLRDNFNSKAGSFGN